MTGNTAFALCGGSGGGDTPSEGMVFKGYVGTPEQPDLPAPTEETAQWMFVVATDGAYTMETPVYYKTDVSDDNPYFRTGFHYNKYSDEECTNLIDSILVEWKGQWSTLQSIDDEFVYAFNNSSYPVVTAINTIKSKKITKTTWETFTPGMTLTGVNFTDMYIIKASGMKVAHEGDHFISDGTKWIRLPGGGSYPSALTEHNIGSFESSVGFLPYKERTAYRIALANHQDLATIFPNFSASSNRHIMEITGFVEDGSLHEYYALNSTIMLHSKEYGVHVYVTDEGKLETAIIGDTLFANVYITVTVRWIETTS